MLIDLYKVYHNAVKELFVFLLNRDIDADQRSFKEYPEDQKVKIHPLDRLYTKIDAFFLKLSSWKLSFLFHLLPDLKKIYAELQNQYDHDVQTSYESFKGLNAYSFFNKTSNWQKDSSPITQQSVNLSLQQEVQEGNTGLVVQEGLDGMNAVKHTSLLEEFQDQEEQANSTDPITQQSVNLSLQQEVQEGNTGLVVRDGLDGMNAVKHISLLEEFQDQEEQANSTGTLMRGHNDDDDQKEGVGFSPWKDQKVQSLIKWQDAAGTLMTEHNHYDDQEETQAPLSSYHFDLSIVCSVVPDQKAPESIFLPTLNSLLAAVTSYLTPSLCKEEKNFKIRYDVTLPGPSLLSLVPDSLNSYFEPSKSFSLPNEVVFQAHLNLDQLQASFFNSFSVIFHPQSRVTLFFEEEKKSLAKQQRSLSRTHRADFNHSCLMKRRSKGYSAIQLLFNFDVQGGWLQEASFESKKWRS